MWCGVILKSNKGMNMYTSFMVVVSIICSALGTLLANDPYIDFLDSQLSPEFFDKRNEFNMAPSLPRVTRFDSAVRHIMLGKRAPSAERAFSMMSLGKRSPSAERAFSMMSLGKREPSSARALSMIGMGKRASYGGHRAMSMIGMGKREAFVDGQRAMSMIGMGKRSDYTTGQRAMAMIGMGKRASPSAERA